MNPPTLHLRPAAAELHGINPATGRPLPPEGADVAWSTYWQRRIRSGDVVVVAPKGPASAPKEK